MARVEEIGMLACNHRYWYRLNLSLAPTLHFEDHVALALQPPIPWDLFIYHRHGLIA